LAENGQLAELYQKMFAFHGACMGWPRLEGIGSGVVLAKLESLTLSAPAAMTGGPRRQFNTDWAIRAFPIGAFFKLIPLIDTRKGRGHPQRRIFGWIYIII
jgi:hypothetical protein